MKSYLQSKSNRLRIDINLAIYTNLFLILMSVLLMMMVPLFRQPIPLHELAQLKTHTTTTTPVIITIHSTDAYHLNTEMGSEKSMRLDALKDSLKKQFRIMDPKQTSICIRSAPEVPYGKVIEMIDWLQHRGAQHVGLLTSPAHSEQADQ